MSKMKNLISDIEACIVNGDLYEDIVSFIQNSAGCDMITAESLVYTVESNLCLDSDRDSWGGQLELF